MLEDAAKMQKYYLLFAASVVSVIALLYGVSPYWFVKEFLGFEEGLRVSPAHILRAVMGLYIAFALFWLYAAFNDEHRRTAVLTTVVFAGGLVSGRLLSLLTDGAPARLLLIYVAMEFAFVPIGIWVFRRAERVTGDLR